MKNLQTVRLAIIGLNRTPLIKASEPVGKVMKAIRIVIDEKSYLKSSQH